MDDLAIKFTNVWEMYRIKFVKDKQVSWEDYWALKDINFSVNKGESLCIIGENGAGKSTLLKLIAGMIEPDRGRVNVRGRVSGLIDIGTEFHPELTGEENIYSSAALFGLSKNEIESKFDQIVEFADIGKFIYAPVKSYSQGMYVRLAFSIAMHTSPDILLIDDILAVGDENYQRKCVRKIFELKEKGTTIISVTHDMNMAQELCRRGIFLKQGRIIRDGPVNEVILLYSTTIGNKNGISGLNIESLNIIFNNGSLFLKCNQKLITKGWGGYISLTSENKRYFSNNATWHIQNRNKREIIARGKWLNLPLTQVWKLKIITPDLIEWSIDLEVKQKVKIGQIEAGLMLTEKYSEWVSSLNKDKIVDKLPFGNQWEEIIGEKIKGNIFGLIYNSDRGSSDSIPAIFMEVEENSNFTLNLYNTDISLKARVILATKKIKSEESLLLPGKHKFFSGKLNLIEDKIKLKRYIDEHRRKLITLLAQLREKKRLRQSITKDRLKIYCDEGKAKLYWEDKEITCGRGMFTRLEYLDKVYTSEEAIWKVQKHTERITIYLKWNGVPFTQIWKLKMGEGYIDWEIEMELVKKLNLWNKEVGINLSGRYQSWFTSDEQGKFIQPEEFEPHQAVFLRNRKSNIVGVEKSKKIPGVCISKVVNSSDWISFIQKDQMDKKIITLLYFININRKDNISLSPGIYTYFKGRIFIGEDEMDRRMIKARFSEKEKHLPLIPRKKSPLRIKFENGIVRLFWDDLELTKGLGMYTSFFSDSWHDSCQAGWKLKIIKNEIIGIGYWSIVPVCQIWKIKIKDLKIILWEVTMEILKKVKINKQQANLMLTNQYMKWLVPDKAQGNFPDKFNDYKGLFWDRMWSSSAESTYLEVKPVKQGDKYLPGVSFNFLEQNLRYQAVVENTDPLFCARVLQFQKLNLNKTSFYKPGKYSYFKGRIRIKNEK